MELDANEEKLLRSVALQNAKAVLLARERAERELVNANQRITNILESITDGFIALDKEWRFIFVNRRAEEILRPLNKSRKSLLGKSHWETFPDTVGTPLEEHFGRAMQEQVTVQFENFYAPLDSWFDVRAYPSPEGLSIYFQDITQRKRDADELRQQREWFEVTLGSIGDAVIATNVEGRITFLNAVAEAMTGWKSSEAAGQRLEDVFKIINEQTREPTPNPISKVLREGKIVGLANHTALIAKGGKETAIEDSAAPIRDAAGKVTGAVMVFHDVTERRRAEASLRESEEQLRAIFNQAAVGIAIASLDGHFMEVNQKYSEIMGYSAEELRKMTVADLTHPNDLAQTRENMRRLVQGEVPHYVVEKRFIRKNGSQIWALTTVTAVKDAAHKPLRFMGVVEDISPRKLAEEAVRDSAQRLQLALSAGHLGDWSWEARTDLVTCGDRCSEIFGLAPDTPVTWSQMRDMLHEEDREPARFAVEQALTNHASYDIDYRVIRPTGECRWVAAKGRGIYAEDGTVLGMTGVVQDITQRKEADEGLRRSEEELRALADSIPQLAWMAEPDGHIFWYNRKWYEYTGTTLEQMEGWGWQSVHVHDPKMLPLVVDRWKESIRTGHPFDMEFPLRGADGVFRWFLTRVNPVRDAEGRVVRWFGTNTDVDTVRRTQEALREETRILELLNDTGRAIASKLDFEGVVQIVTDAATKLCGAKFGAFYYNVTNQEGEAFLLYTLSGAPREAYEKFGMPRNTPAFSDTFRGQGVVRSADITKDSRYGQMKPPFGMPKGHFPVCSYLAVAVISRSGEVIGGLFFGHPEPDVFTERSERLIVGVAAQAAIAIDNARLYEGAQHEISERKRVEEVLREAQDELSHHAEDLEKQVVLRTASLREAIAQLEEFSYSVSHDLRAPLRAIAGYTRLFKTDYGAELPPEAHSFLEKISQSAHRMDRLVNDVLTMSRVARAEMNLRPIALQRFIEEIVEQHPEMQAPAADLSITAPHLVLADDASLNQAVSNLLANAVKFVHPGVKPIVKIRSEQNGERVRIWVEDSGIGIKPDERGKLFGMFQRLPSSLQYEGTGIGLAIVRRAVERMGGAVGFEPNRTGGSRFWVELKGQQ